MKNLFVLCLLSVAALARATELPGWEWAVYEAKLVQMQGSSVPPRAVTLTMNHSESSGNQGSSFVLVEDTGIVCVTAPCPTRKKAYFHVLQAMENKSNVIDYQAIEMNPENGRSRTMYVSDFATHWLKPEKRWQVTIMTGQAGDASRSYVGYYVPLH